MCVRSVCVCLFECVCVCVCVLSVCVCVRVRVRGVRAWCVCFDPVLVADDDVARADDDARHRHHPVALPRLRRVCVGRDGERGRRERGMGGGRGGAMRSGFGEGEEEGDVRGGLRYSGVAHTDAARVLRHHCFLTRIWHF